jgi:hypothetical protein
LIYIIILLLRFTTEKEISVDYSQEVLRISKVVTAVLACLGFSFFEFSGRPRYTCCTWVDGMQQSFLHVDPSGMTPAILVPSDEEPAVWQVKVKIGKYSRWVYVDSETYDCLRVDATVMVSYKEGGVTGFPYDPQVVGIA